MAEALPVFPRSDPSPDAGDVVIRWRKWTSRFKNLMTAINVTNDARQKALLLHYVGEETNDIFHTLVVPQPAEGETHTNVAIKVQTLCNKAEQSLKCVSFDKLNRKNEKISQHISLASDILQQLANLQTLTETSNRNSFMLSVESLA